MGTLSHVNATAALETTMNDLLPVAWSPGTVVLLVRCTPYPKGVSYQKEEQSCTRWKSKFDVQSDQSRYGTDTWGPV